MGAPTPRENNMNTCKTISLLTLIALIGAIPLLVIFFRLESWPVRTAKEGTAEFERIARSDRGDVPGLRRGRR